MTPPHVVSLLDKNASDGWVLRRRDGSYLGETTPMKDLVTGGGEELELVQVDRP